MLSFARSLCRTPLLARPVSNNVFASSRLALSTMRAPVGSRALLAAPRRSEGGNSNGTPGKKSIWRSFSTDKGPVSWTSFALIVAAGGVVLVIAEYFNQKKKEEMQKTKPLPTIGQAALGGPFVLQNSKGETVTTLDLQGKWLLLYFGFTFCPDVCPNELAKMTDVVHILDKKIGPKVTPVFITIDPQRDTPEMIGEYVLDYHPRFLALTGTPSQILDVTKKFRVYYSRSPTGDGPNDYLVDHSILQFLVNPNGQFVEFYGKNKTVPDIVEAISRHVAAFKG